MKQLIIVFFCSCLFSITVFASSSSKLENRLVDNLAKAISKTKSPEDAVKKLGNRLKKEEVTFLSGLIKQDKWTEMPNATFDGNTINLKFSHGITMELEVVDYWKGEFAVNGYKLETKRYDSLPDKIAYLNRVVQKQYSNRNRKTTALFSFMVPEAEAFELGCNALIETTCIEVSMATAIWFAREIAKESPISTCTVALEIVTIKKCHEQYNNNETIMTIHQLGEILAQAPTNTDISMECKNDRLAKLWIDGTLVAGYENKNGTSVSDLGDEQNPKGIFNKLPELTNRCCTKNDDDEFTGKCEEFVHEHLGDPKKRKQEYHKPYIKLKGQALPGVR